MKQIEICGKRYNIACNAFTHVQYRKIFNKSIFDDIQLLKDYLVTQILTSVEILDRNPNISQIEVIEQISNAMTPKMDDFVEVVTRIAYILIYSANEYFESYEEFLKSITSLKIDDNWIVEVTEFAVDCFR